MLGLGFLTWDMGRQKPALQSSLGRWEATTCFVKNKIVTAREELSFLGDSKSLTGPGFISDRPSCSHLPTPTLLFYSCGRSQAPSDTWAASVFEVAFLYGKLKKVS